MDEYDALLEEPFGEDIDWAAIDSISTSTKSNGDCFICREPANAIFIPNFSIDRLAELYFKNKLDMNETEKEEYHQWQNRLEAGRKKFQAKRPKRFKSKKSTAQLRDRGREGHGERHNQVTINANPPPFLDPPGGPLTPQFTELPPHNSVAIIPSNPSLVNRPQRNQRQRQSAPVIVRPEVITEDIIRVIPYHHHTAV
ncbi:hypothetical protein Clacol_003678 [Clathrus columnatus]|uniref:Uncharacterized protein n=1 Tax=Clathrus columnatus TaxID=1419009 RepID=A0AAV5A927_9AGAM|nr:hypothetical protein Clacol_003678 [Clathrus columnatus]